MLHQTFIQTKRLLQKTATAFCIIHQDSIINDALGIAWRSLQN